VTAGRADYGVLPIENALAGSVHENYDLLGSHDLAIAGEYYLEIEHCLLVKPGRGKGGLAGIKKVYSHPKALEQCTEFFRQHPDIEASSYSDTATAARLVAESDDDTCAAIAGEQAAQLYGLEVAQRRIADSEHNITRFLVATSTHRKVTDANKCSLIMRLPHREGSLYRALGVLAQHHCNISKIESRPIHGEPFEYMFYIDFEYGAGTQVDEVLADLGHVADEVKVLGIYRAALQG
jgi:prephenate dehydratase